MPYRPDTPVNGELYHVFNRSTGSDVLFPTPGCYGRFFDLISYYRHEKTPQRYSQYCKLPDHIRDEVSRRLEKSDDLRVDILVFTLMPDHYHLILRQKIDNGISDFIRIIQNSYAKYLNTKSDRHGAVFQAMFKFIRIDTESYLMELSRYIHRNPLKAGITGTPEETAAYPWSSLAGYLGTRPVSFLDTLTVGTLFPKPNAYRDFVFSPDALKPNFSLLPDQLFLEKF